MYLVLGILGIFSFIMLLIAIAEQSVGGAVGLFFTCLVCMVFGLGHTLITNNDRTWYDRQIASRPYYIKTIDKKELTTKYANTRLWGILNQSNWEFERGYTRKEAIERRSYLIKERKDCTETGESSCKIFLETDR